jgi:hypothetical protein
MFAYPFRRKPVVSREKLFQFIRQADQVRFRCELHDHAEGGVEAQFWMNGSLLIGRRFDTRSQAVQWARFERRAIKKGGF